MARDGVHVIVCSLHHDVGRRRHEPTAPVHDVQHLRANNGLASARHHQKNGRMNKFLQQTSDALDRRYTQG